MFIMFSCVHTDTVKSFPYHVNHEHILKSRDFKVSKHMKVLTGKAWDSIASKIKQTCIKYRRAFNTGWQNGKGRITATFIDICGKIKWLTSN